MVRWWTGAVKYGKVSPHQTVLVNSNILHTLSKFQEKGAAQEVILRADSSALS